MSLNFEITPSRRRNGFNVFHIKRSHSYEGCHFHDIEKVNVKKAAFDGAEKRDDKIHYNIVNRLTHKDFFWQRQKPAKQ